MKMCVILRCSVVDGLNTAALRGTCQLSAHSSQCQWKLHPYVISGSYK